MSPNHDLDSTVVVMVLCAISCYTWPRYGRHSSSAVQWRHNEGGNVSNHRFLDCLLNRLFRPKENIKAPRYWPLGGIHRWLVNFRHIRPVTRKMFPFKFEWTTISIFYLDLPSPWLPLSWSCYNTTPDERTFLLILSLEELWCQTTSSVPHRQTKE